MKYPGRSKCAKRPKRDATVATSFGRLVSLAILYLCYANVAYAGSVEKRAADNSPKAELASFEITEGYEVNLFASESNEIANPIAIHFDGRDRLWVLCSLVYPQLVPTKKADDKIYVLEDTDDDGVADKTTIFAEGLNMPTGFLLGDGGVYVGEGSNLVFLEDKDGDDKADSKRTIFSGFGTGDTHQNINSFTWTPDGEILFCQGLHAFSRIETPWGIKKLDEHGVWRMRPRRLQLDAFRGVAGQNPWGLGFGRWGEGFVKGNGTSLSELTPVAVPSLNRAKELAVGHTKIKAMGALIVDSPHLPDDIQGNVIIAGYYGHVMDRMSLSPDGAGHKTENLPPLFRTDHPSFRPVDAKVGPDGAIYIADWYNPIIGHYQASLRHPDRDKVHGRIWRVTAKGRDLLEKPKVENLSIELLVKKLGSPIRYERDRAREVLSGKPTNQVVAALGKWINLTDDEHHLYEALCVYAWHEVVNLDLLKRLSKAKETRARAFAARMAGRWQDRIPDAAVHLKEAVNDPNPRVRLEAVVSCGYLDSAEGFTNALEAFDHPVDRFIETALTQISHYQKPMWFTALKEGNIRFAKPAHLAFALSRTSGSDAAGTARTMLADPELDGSIKDTLLILLAQSRKPNDQVEVLNQALGKPSVLSALGDAVELHGIRPKTIPGSLESILKDPDPAIRSQAIRLAGLWNGSEFVDLIKSALGKAEPEVQIEAIKALGRLQGEAAIETIVSVAGRTGDPRIHEASLDTIAVLDLPKAALLGESLLTDIKSIDQLKAIVTPFIRQKGGLDAFVDTIKAKRKLTPFLSIGIRSIVGNAGAYSSKLDEVLGSSPGGAKLGIPAYSESLVQELSTAATKGSVAKGKEVFATGAVSCLACHQTDAKGAVLRLGPDLSAVGAGLPVELIVESILWPKRQVKEGFLSSSITTKSGRLVTGYIQKESKQQIDIRDAATGKTTTIAVSDIASRTDAGTLMPPGLTANLTKTEFVDMVAYLVSLKGQ